MIPTGFPPVAPSLSIADLFGPLAPVAVFACLAALAVLVALVAGESWMASRRRSARLVPATGVTPLSSELRSAA
jgi:hypothetical protein